MWDYKNVGELVFFSVAVALRARTLLVIAQGMQGARARLDSCTCNNQGFPELAAAGACRCRSVLDLAAAFRGVVDFLVCMFETRFQTLVLPSYMLTRYMTTARLLAFNYSLINYLTQRKDVGTIRMVALHGSPQGKAICHRVSQFA